MFVDSAPTKRQSHHEQFNAPFALRFFSKELVIKLYSHFIQRNACFYLDGVCRFHRVSA